MTPNARVLVVEHVLPDKPRSDLTIVSDFLKLALLGRERTASEYQLLFESVGLNIDRKILLSTGATVFQLSETTSPTYG